MIELKHDEYISAALGEKYRETAALGYQCVAFVKRYCEKVIEPIGSFSGSALNGRKTGSPFNKNWQRIQNTKDAVPRQGDIIFFDKTPENQYGHVAVVQIGNQKSVAVVEQNGGKGSGTGLGTDAIRISTYDYKKPKILGWYSFVG